jgi:hypothetical protein
MKNLDGIRYAITPRTTEYESTRFIESNVTILSNSCKEELDPSCIFDCLFIVLALFNQINVISVQNMDVLGVNVDWYDRSVVSRTSEPRSRTMFEKFLEPDQRMSTESD